MNIRILSKPGVVILLVAGVLLSGNRVQARSSGSRHVMIVQPGAGSSPVISLMNSARRTLRLEIYLITDRDIVRALSAAVRRGVNVRVVLEEHPFRDDRAASAAYGELQAAAVPVHWANETAFTFTHAKSMEVDGRVAGIFTFNLSYSGLLDNREFGIIDYSSTDARTIGAIIDADWSRRSVRLTDPSLIVSPVNSRRDLDSLIDGARRTLDVYAEEVADSSIEGHLIRAAHRGVRVRVITSAQSAGTDTLRGSGVHVIVLSSPYVHAKAMVADGNWMFVGSENLSSTSLDRNREIGLFLQSRALARIVERTFSLDLAAAGGYLPPSRTVPPPVSHSSGQLSVVVRTDPGSVRRGQLLTVTAHADAGATCTIRVTYPDGYVSRAASLSGTRTTDPTGYASWSWHVGSTVTGTAHADVSCTLGSRSGSGDVTFQIT